MNQPTKSSTVIRPFRATRQLMIAHSDHYLVDELVACLIKSGFEVYKSATGIACIEHLKQNTTDVLVLDLDLLWGGGDGVLTVMATYPELACIQVLLLVSAGKSPVVSKKLRALVSETLTLPSSNETITERCIELAESNLNRRQTRSLTHVT